MDVTGVLIDLVRAEPDRPGAGKPPLRVGDVLQLSVLEVLSAGRVRVDLGKLRAVAEIRFPVTPGDRLKVEVESIGKQLRLRVLPPPDSGAAQSAAAERPAAFRLNRFAQPLKEGVDGILARPAGRTGAPKLPEEVANALKAVSAHLEPVRPGGGIQELAARLKQLVESSGLFLEKKLETLLAGLSRGEKPPAETMQGAARLLDGDLKAQLLVLRRYFEPPAVLPDRQAPDGAGQLRRAIDGMLADISAARTAARAAEPNQPFQVVMYDLPLADGRRGGRLKMYFPKKGRQRERSAFRLSLLLDLDRLGMVRSDLVLRENGLSLMFFTARRRVKSHLDAHLDRIEAALRPFFPGLTVSVALAESKLSGFDTDILQVDGDRHIDMRV